MTQAEAMREAALNAAIEKAIADAVATEREACAKIAESAEPVNRIDDEGFREESVWRTNESIAAKIRARGAQNKA